MQSYTKEEQAFLIYHELIGILFRAASHDKEIAALVRRRLYNEMPRYVAEWLIDVIHYIEEYKNDLQHQDQPAS